MYISNITIKGFRNFDNTTVDFHDGINVIIGHNNAGKTNILKALSLVTSNDMHIPADTRSAFPVISVQSPVSIQCCWQS